MNKPKVFSLLYIGIVLFAVFVVCTFVGIEIRDRDARKTAWEEHKYQQRVEEMKRLQPGEIIVSDSKIWMVTGKYNNKAKAKILNPDGTPDETQFTAVQLKVDSISNGKVTLTIDTDATMTANFLESHNGR